MRMAVRERLFSLGSRVKPCFETSKSSNKKSFRKNTIVSFLVLLFKTTSHVAQAGLGLLTSTTCVLGLQACTSTSGCNEHILQYPYCGRFSYFFLLRTLFSFLNYVTLKSLGTILTPSLPLCCMPLVFSCCDKTP